MEASSSHKTDSSQDNLTKENFERHFAAMASAAAAAAAAAASMGSTTSGQKPGSSFLIEDILFPR